MSDFRTRIDEQASAGVRFEVYQFERKSHVLNMPLPAASASGGTAPVIHLHPPHAATARQVRIVLEGGAALLEPGALQYAHGKLQVDIQKNAGAGGFLSRAITSAGSGESAFATRYAGYGEVWTEVTTKHFILAAMDGPQDALILDDGAFYACDANVALSTHIHRSVQGILSGNGLMQPKLTGAGAFVVESPVPADEIEVVELDGQKELIVDGDLMLMYSAGLQVELRPLVRGLRNAWRSGEGLVYLFRGRGTVWLTPTMRLG
ncbi:AIM24 family protein [Sphingomonas sp. H39-1-10]|uniref:AIM24 family protein n=1 Tax=Sphingomonas pollutisoli TaxID=3030829 RepID=UPI0023B9F579|nr:AIM24 family protein [Sphingomonas pollutisoli]MDF0487216.1 AIM24 family protein [Sphingomonas pollutisoli]